MSAFADDFKKRNFNIYGQWLAILSMILGFALGIANIFTFRLVIIIFSCLLIASAFLIVFMEIPFLLRICPTSSTFDANVRKLIETTWMRAGVYGVMALLQWLSLLGGASSLIAEAVFLTGTALCFSFAALKGQTHENSSVLTKGARGAAGAAINSGYAGTRV